MGVWFSNWEEGRSQIMSCGRFPFENHDHWQKGEDETNRGHHGHRGHREGDESRGYRGHGQQ